jgi:hypothetical protein
MLESRIVDRVTIDVIAMVLLLKRNGWKKGTEIGISIKFQ